MTLDDILKLVQELLTKYKNEDDREHMVMVLEDTYAKIMEAENPNDEVIDFLDSVMFDVDYLIEQRREIITKSENEVENRKRRRKMLDMFSEDYL